MNLTEEQSIVKDTVLNTDEKLVVVDAVSGAGKTAMLVDISKALNPKNGLYLAYNKAIATEAASKFPESVVCKTTHSMAYSNVVKPMNLSVGFFSYRDIKMKMQFADKILVVDAIKDYCLSKYVNINDFITAKEIRDSHAEVIKNYLGKMKRGEIDCTHDFYLKYYHILLDNKTLVHEEFDIVMLDEAGDLNPVTLEIFKLLPAKKKLMVGDPNQNIYTFNNTINGFKEMEGVGVHLPLSQSFRVKDSIAAEVEDFCIEFFNPNMKFKGVPYTDEETANISTTAFIARTNSTIIGEMINLNEANRPYGLTRKAAIIFELPLGLITLKSKGFIKVKQYKFLEEDYRDYVSSPRLQTNSSFFGYLAELYEDDIAIKSAVSLISKYGPGTIIDTFEKAKSHESGNHSHTLCTSHSSKGLEFDMVTIGEDTNVELNKILTSSHVVKKGLDGMDATEREAFRLAYVAGTRAKKQLKNAKFLTFQVGVDNLL